MKIRYIGYFALFLNFFPFLLGWSGITGISGLGCLIFAVVLILDRKDGYFVSLFKKMLKPKIVFSVSAIISFVALAVIADKLWSLSYRIMDDICFANGVVTYLKTGAYFNSIVQIPALADHFTPNLLLFAPLFKLFPSIIWLDLARWAALVWTGWLIWQLARRHLNEALSTIPVFFWFASETVVNLHLASFQPNLLAVPFFAWAILSIDKGKIWLALIPLIFLLGFKENMAIYWIVAGAYAFLIQDQKKLGIALAVGGLLIGFTTVYALVPFFSGQSLVHLGTFGPFNYIPDKIKLIVLIILSFGGVHLIHWKPLLLLLSSFGLALVSQKPTMFGIVHHYQAMSLVTGTIAMISALKEWDTNIRTNNPKFSAVAPTIFLWLLLTLNHKLPQNTVRMSHYNYQIERNDAGKFYFKHHHKRDYAKYHEDVRYIREQLEPGKRLYLENDLAHKFVDYWDIRYFVSDDHPITTILGDDDAYAAIFFGSHKDYNVSKSDHDNIIDQLKRRGYSFISKNNSVIAAVRK